MKGSSGGESAKIYQFPIGGRAALANRRDGESKSPIDQTTPYVSEACSGSWYHEEAIQESRPGWER